MSTEAIGAAGSRRKPPAERRDEIARAAGHIAGGEGLVQVTAKRVADVVGVYPGLVTHYFKSADELVAAAFASAVELHRDTQLAAIAAAETSTAQLRAFLQHAVAPEHDSTALLWLDAWRESPRRPALQREVIRQMEIDLTDLGDLLAGGVTAGEFHTDDCAAAAMRILAMVDGTTAQSAVRTAVARGGLINYPVVTEMLFRTTEHELGLAAGSLD